MVSKSSGISHFSTRNDPVLSSTEIVAPAAAPASQTSVSQAPLPPKPEPEPPLSQKPGQAPAPPRTQRSVFEQYALYGLAGKIVRTLAPHTEAQPEAILLQLLAAFGNIIGAGPHCMVGATRHSLNLFVILVGESSKARKGTSWNQIARLFAGVDPAWAANRVTSERVTPRGLTSLLAQEQAGDQRLLVLAEELASMLHTMGRSRSQLSPLLRSAWDSGTLRMLTSDRSLHPSRGHLSLIGHITQRELDASLHRTDTHNGFANRCLWACVQRVQCLPDGGDVPTEELATLAHDLRRAVEWAAREPELVLRRDQEAGELWNSYYATLSQAKDEIHGTATGRAEAQVLRLSALYATLDCSPLIRLPHLEAALALWDYCAGSAAFLFGTCVGDAITDRIHEALQSAEDGLSRFQIRTLFHGHVSSSSIEEALERLNHLGAVNSRQVSGRGRPVTVWSAVDPSAPEQEESSQPGESFGEQVLDSILKSIWTT
jgi:hypothetical protein